MHAEREWKLEATIQEVQDLAAALPQNGKKLCLFIGRVPGEPFPGFGQQKPENEIWISLDHRRDTHKFLQGQQIHLVLDIYDERIERISHLFDKVIVDVGTIRHFNKDADPWSHLIQFLKPHCDSQLITEASTLALISISALQAYKGLSLKEARQAYLNENIQVNLKKLEESKRFANIELCQQAPFPYMYKQLKEDVSYFILAQT